MKIYYRIRDWFQNHLYNLKWRCQRFIRGYSDDDVYNPDYWFVDTFKKMLDEIVNNCHSCPVDFSIEDWKEQLFKMLGCLELMQTETATRALFGLEDYELNYDQISTLYQKQEEATKNFFDMYQKYFYKLWF